jgi:hypothetical protein
MDIIDGYLLLYIWVRYVILDFISDALLSCLLVLVFIWYSFIHSVSRVEVVVVVRLGSYGDTEFCDIFLFGTTQNGVG